MRWLGITLIWSGVLVLGLVPAALAGKTPSSPEAAEFFERKVRPVLAAHCFQCHSRRAKKLKAELLLDSRAGLLNGGESGPVVDLRRPEKSRLIEALRYKDADLQMPPKGKLPDSVIADLAAWLKMGAPWPEEKDQGTATGKAKFDLARRKREHWAWRPLRPAQPPAVKNTRWPRGPVDRFLLARLEDKGLTPAPAADRRVLLRRLFFGLIGLPPQPPEVAAFLNDDSPNALEKVVDRLLASPRFGERWARHWLDLVRYAETRGHEFDYVAPNAYQYRDYVVRALNADVPYNRFVTEHIAGDLLSGPPRHPTLGFNESILGTGFWFLGEEVHSPVDVRQDEADRFDNKIDVLTKTFLGLTVSCARCHDHKFDAISTKDYYALYGFLKSSSYRLARFDSAEHNQRIARELADLRRKSRPVLQRALAESLRPTTEHLAEYLLTALEALQVRPEVEKGGDVVFEDFENGTYRNWTVTGTAFGTRPQTLHTIAKYQGRINAVGKFFVNSHNVRKGEDVRQGDAHTGTLTSRKFTVAHDSITMLVGGGAHAGKTCVNMLINGKVVRTATGRNSNQMFPVRWDVRSYRRQSAQIQIVDNATGGWGNIGVDHIVFTNKMETPDKGRAAKSLRPKYRERLEKIARTRHLDPVFLTRWAGHLSSAARDTSDPLHLWAKLAAEPASQDSRKLAELLRPTLAAWRQRDTEAANALKRAEVVIDYARSPAKDWLPDGPAFGQAPVRPGDIRFGQDPARPILKMVDYAAAEKDPLWDGLRPAPGAENDPGALGRVVRSGRTIRTPAFKITTGKVFYLVKGSGSIYAAVDSHALIAGPLHGQLVMPVHVGADFRWVVQDLSRYKGQYTHIEFTPTGIEEFAVARVVQAENAPAFVDPPNHLLLKACDGKNAGSLQALAQAHQRLFAGVVERLAGDRIVGSKDATDCARLSNWLLEHSDLFTPARDGVSKRLAKAAEKFLAAQAKLVKQIRKESRLAMAILDGTGLDEHVFLRGSHKTPGELVPRRFLEALAGPKPLRIPRGSGRRELAREMTDPALNPFLARVHVNRLWHHLFGRGIVASVDNFGVLGERPTHPELLDYLADRFIQEGWSVKKMIRTLVLSSAYRMAATPGGDGNRLDPENLLLHRMRIRRLEGEAIRDSMLQVSGRLDSRMYGRSVPVFLTPFLEGRGRPASGPLDGDGRRSVYIAVRRNFLSPFLLAFDTPIPFSTVGRRTVSNVPAQALILMNDPFVHQQAALWARHTLDRGGTPEERISAMYQAAFCRPPTKVELAECLEFLKNQAQINPATGQAKSGGLHDPRAWADLAHVLFNAKEFIFLQ
jgi:hypothetical protein